MKNIQNFNEFINESYLGFDPKNTNPTYDLDKLKGLGVQFKVTDIDVFGKTESVGGDQDLWPLYSNGEKIEGEPLPEGDNIFIDQLIQNPLKGIIDGFYTYGDSGLAIEITANNISNVRTGHPAPFGFPREKNVTIAYTCPNGTIFRKVEKGIFYNFFEYDYVHHTTDPGSFLKGKRIAVKYECKELKAKLDSMLPCAGYMTKNDPNIDTKSTEEFISKLA